MSQPFTVACAMTAGFEELVEACADLAAARLVPCPDDASVESVLAHADGMVVYASRYTARVARAVRSSRVRWIHVVTAGTDSLSASPPSPSVLLSGGGRVWTAPVAEHAIALLLALKRNLHGAVRHAADPAWTRERAIPSLGFVNGSTVLVVGLGAIGGAIAGRLLALGAQVTGIARRDGQRDGIAVHPIESLDALLPGQESVVVCVPLTDSTRGLFGARQFERMRSGAILVDVSRGGVVDDAALVDGLRRGQPAAAGLDVFSREPLPPDHPLRSLPNVILTPHVAGFGGQRVLREMAAVARDNLADLLEGRDPRDRIRLAGATP